MTRLILVRHLRTDMTGCFCGHTDPELNERGLSQLPNVLKALSKYAIDKVYTSDLRRAQQTAQAIAGHFAAEIDFRRGLREIYFGLWEGLSWREIENRDPAAAKTWADQYPNGAAPGGESIEEFRSRVREEIAFSMERSAGRVSAVVTHAGFMRVALAICGVPEQEAWNRTRDCGSIVVLDSSCGQIQIRDSNMRGEEQPQVKLETFDWATRSV